jgi:hypothetical protein
MLPGVTEGITIPSVSTENELSIRQWNYVIRLGIESIGRAWCDLSSLRPRATHTLAYHVLIWVRVPA